MKKKILISYVCDADTDLSAIFALNKALRSLSENELEKFDVVDVVDVEEK